MIKTFVVAAAAAVAFAGASNAQSVPERLISDLQADFDLQDFHASGIAGNLARETGNFRYLQELDPIIEGSRGGAGYAQWTASRRLAFEAWAGPDADLTSYEVNYGFLSEELSGEYSRVVDRIRETKTVEEAAEVFMKLFLRPHKSYRHLDERIAYGEAYLAGDFSGAGCQAVHELVVQGDLVTVAMCDPELDSVTVVATTLPQTEPAPADPFERLALLMPDEQHQPVEPLNPVRTEVYDPFATMALLVEGDLSVGRPDGDRPALA